MMKFTPPKNKTAKCFSFACMIIGCLLIATLFLDVPYQVIFEVIALIFYVLSFELMFRYSFTTYTYIIEDGNFIVRKQTGQKAMYACNISMRTAKALVKTPKTKEEKEAFAKKYGRVKIRYNYCQVLFPQDSRSYLFQFNGELAEIVFQPDTKMEAEILRVIAEKIDEDDEFY